MAIARAIAESSVEDAALAGAFLGDSSGKICEKRATNEHALFVTTISVHRNK
jgi:hypothetical protein